MKKENHEILTAIRLYEIKDIEQIRNVVKDTYTILDVETTGTMGDMTEIAALRVEEGQMVDIFHTLVKAKEKIKPVVKQLTGMTDDMLKTAPEWEYIYPQLVAFLGDSILVGHSIDMDLLHIYFKSKSEGKSFSSGPYIDTNMLAHQVVPDVDGHQKYSVQALCEWFQLPCQYFHRALWDCEAEKMLFEILVESYGKIK